MIKGQIYMEEKYFDVYALFKMQCANGNVLDCLLYTSDAADEL